MQVRRNRPSLKELSEHLGMSMTTVSRALNGYDDVSGRTRERVIETAKAMGYTANAQARRLTSGSTESIGFVMSDVGDYFGGSSVAELLAGLTDALHKADRDLVIAATQRADDPLAPFRRLVDGQRVDGLILDQTRQKDPRVDYLLERGFPFVAFGRTGRAAEHAFLDFDGEAAFFNTAQRLIRLGHKRIAMIGANSSYHFVQLRRRGFERALAQAGLSLAPDHYQASGFNQAAGAAATHKLLNLPIPPTAIMCIDDLTALGAMAALRDHQLKAGRDISITGYNDIPTARLCDPPLTTVSMPARTAGNRLAEMLLALLGGEVVDNLQELWETKLVVRESDGPLPGR